MLGPVLPILLNILSLPVDAAHNSAQTEGHRRHKVRQDPQKNDIYHISHLDMLFVFGHRFLAKNLAAPDLLHLSHLLRSQRLFSGLAAHLTFRDDTILFHYFDQSLCGPQILLASFRWFRRGVQNYTRAVR